MDPSLSTSVSLQGKRILITGGTTGIGRATAKLLSAAGCRVFICGRDPQALADAIEAARSPEVEIGGITTDLGSTEGVLELFAAADEWLGGLDVAILNAGLALEGKLTAMSHEECRQVVDVNLGGYIACALESMKRMKESGGHIVMTGSMSAETREKESAVYVATKAGIRGFASSLRKEANEARIGVSLIEPGSVGTDMVDETPGEQVEEQKKLKMLTAEDIALSIWYVLSQAERSDVVMIQIRPKQQAI